ncbi:MAG: beta-propeller fold lactonase family protein [Verrucomicrobiales bacterium]
MKFYRVVLLACICFVPRLAFSGEVWVYFGTYTRGKESEGIYLAKLDVESGRLSSPKLAASADNPSFLAITPDASHLIAVEETNDFEGNKSGSLVSFGIDQASGLLQETSRIATRGGAPCHVTVDSAGRHALFANYVGGSVGAASISAEGILKLSSFSQHAGSSVSPRQAAPHAHSIDLDPAGRFVVCSDLGLDKVMVYQYDPVKGALTVNDPGFVKVTAGSGPRHFAFRPDSRFGYTNNEITSSVTAFSYDGATGSFKQLQTLSTLPDEGYKKHNSTAELIVHPGGRFLYCSNRGHDSIAVFAIDSASGKLSLVEIETLGVKTPRGFGIEPGGRYLVALGQNSGNARVFAIDPESGALSPAGGPVTVPNAVCVQFLHAPAKNFTRIFDGSSMKGWQGDQTWFRVEAGAIVAGTQKKRIPKNQFLVSEKVYGDFELRFKARLIGQGKNAGVQFWSERIPDHHEMIGFQCDIGIMGKASIWGALYDESRRRKFLQQVPLSTRGVTDIKGWNQFRIRAEGSAITIWVNGALATRYFENESKAKIPRKGRFGLQIHSGPPAEAWYKDIEVREL